MAVGRISGPLLKDNLLRNGVNLAFETSLLYLDVVNGRVGINTTTPTNDLTVNGTTRTSILQVTTEADIATFTVTNNTIASSSGTINFLPSGSNPTVYQGTILVNNNLTIGTNTIQTTVSGSNLNINTTGTGQVVVNSNMLVNGNLHATGNITADGNITLGNQSTDTVTFDAEVASSVLPATNNLYNLGSDPTAGGQAWANAYIHNIHSTNITAPAAVINGIDIVLPQGNIYYVATNGSDSNAGVHENNPFLTIAHALSVATSGTTVYVYPGTYTEVFPLTVPEGVTLKGAGLRSVAIQPTVGTITNDAILLNGETTVEDLTLTGYRYNSVGNTGYGFRFASNFLVSSRSPYVRNVTIITKGSVTSSSDPYGYNQGDAGKGVYLDGSVVNAASNNASMLFHGVTIITPAQDSIVATNGVRIEWLNSFTYFANKGIYGISGSTGFAGVGKTRLTISNRTGTWAVGNTVSYYDTDGVTVLGSGTIASISGDDIYLTGKCAGFQTITDRTGKTVYAQGNAKLSTAQKKYGTASLTLDGVGDYVSVPSNPDFQFGTDSYTFEGWFYNTGGRSAVQVLFDMRTAEPQVVPYLNIQTNGSLLYYVNGVSRITTAAGVVPLNAWTHIAISRQAGVGTKLFVNGTQVGLTSYTALDYIQAPFNIGARFDGTLGFVGYVDDVRIEKGIAKYTSTFTPPASALASDNNTVLMLHFDGTNNATIFLDDGYTQQDVRTNAGGRATIIDFADYSQFGAEIRSIGSANIYGRRGAYGDGLGVLMYLIGHNFAYVGAGADTSNSPLPEGPEDEGELTGGDDWREVIELNGAKIFYTSVNDEGDYRVGDKFYVDQKTGDVLFNSQSLNITSVQGVTFTDGTHTTTVLPGEVDTGNIRISGNTIESVTGDVNVTAASGSINLQNNTYITGNLDVTGNFVIGGNITIGDQTTDTINFVAGINSNLIPAANSTYDLGTPSLTWANSYFTSANLGNITISGNTVSTTTGDLNLQPTGSNSVQIRNLSVNNNVVSSVNTNADIVLVPQGTGSVVINSNQSFIVPVGDTAHRPSGQNGMVRYNIDSNRYEGYANGYWTNLGGVQSVDGKTYITPESSPGAGNNIISFYANNNLTAYIDSSKLYTDDFKTANIDISGNTISTYTTGTDLNLTTAGTGSVIIGNLHFNNNTITNNSSGAVTQFTATSTGYYKFNGTYGVTIPVGAVSSRPATLYAETGMIRFNTDLQAVEVFNGAAWGSIVGLAGGINSTQASDIGIATVLTFG